MTEAHPGAAQLEQFRRCELSREKARGVVRHLLSGCASCQEVTSQWWPTSSHQDVVIRRVVSLNERDGRGYDYEQVFERLSEELLERKLELAEEQAVVPRLREDLSRHPVDRQLVLIQNSRRFQVWSLAESLLVDCQAQRPRNPEAAVDFARLAVAVAENLPADRYSEPLAHDLKARAWAELASAQRVRGQFPESEAAFEKARQWAADGTGDPIEKAHILWLEASLRVDLRDFDGALALLQRVIRTARRHGESHLWGKALISKGMCEGFRGQADDEIRLIREGVDLIDPGLDPRLVLVVRHNLIHSLVSAGRYHEALECIDEARALHHKLGNELDLIRFSWIEGRVYQGLGRTREAEALYRSAQDKFLKAELDYDAALVCLDLAAIYSCQGRHGEMKQLAEAMLPIFRSRQIGREAIAALLVFREAVEMEQVSLGLVREVAEHLRQLPGGEAQLRLRSGSQPSAAR
ncbi:MAG: tetratricopeptide repeat protein [Acidobacteriota bacterium]